ncbi:MAG: hypothetical protein QME25_05615 [Bacteroidota bacterium]|nr:hypothetical protein [Bacteroidota bacterium]
MNRILKITLHAILIFLICTGALAQYIPGKERGDPKYRAKGQMEGNNIRTTIHNFCLTGRTGGEFPYSEQTPYEWPKNTGQVYLAMTVLFVGGEVIDNTGTIQKIVDVGNFRTSPEGKTWNLEPVPGYYNPNRQEVATSVDKETWPPFWPDRLGDQVDPGWRGSWNGYFGKNIFNADQEMFFRASDDRYYRFVDYFPDTTDLTRKGLGILVDVRTLAWNQVLVNDALYLLNYVKNDGTKDITKVAVTLWYADFVGGDGDSQDDWSEFDLIQDIAWSYDKDHKAPQFGNNPVGIVAVTFLETPGNAIDRIDNDGDGETLGRKITASMLVGEIPDNLIDDNGNGLIDENQTHIPFGYQVGVTFADGIDDNNNAEAGSPTITNDMVSLVQSDQWKRWPPFPEQDTLQKGRVHLILVDASTVGKAFKNYIDDNGNGETNSPTITQQIINIAAQDSPYFRYEVPESNIILYNVRQTDLGKKYADGKDNDNNGAIDEFMDEGIDEMIDEARDNGIDDDGDWNPLTDDVGLDGVPDTGDFGEGDGKPTSGARFGLPGEPNVDVTDVSETDQIGITNAQYIPAGALNISTVKDAQLWFDFMIPGKFYDPLLGNYGEYDLLVSSGFFPLKSGQTEPISLAVLLANGPVPDPNANYRKAEILRKRHLAQETYNNDYQFAKAPLIPTLTAVPGDNRVTLYWDDIAERSFDTYIHNIGGVGKDFEGYRIYRVSDPAFQDAQNITTGHGIKKFYTPIKIFDIKNGIKGFHPVDFQGVHFWLGDDSGLQHSWVDTTVQNGFTYYYAITSFDFGYTIGGFMPSECAMTVALKPDGTVKLSSNVARVTPEAPAAGYVPATLGKIDLVKGTTTGTINYEIIDLNKIKNNHVYYITFEDTLKRASRTGVPDTLTTKNFTLTDSTDNQILIDKSRNMDFDYEQPLVDGFKLSFKNEMRVEVNKSISKWSNPNIPPFTFEKFMAATGEKGEERPNDYNILFANVGTDTSTPVKIGTKIYPALPVNFKVYNRSTNKFIDFGFIEVDTSFGEGKLSAKGAFKDRIIFLEPNIRDSLVFTWWFYLSVAPDTSKGFMIPQPGDSATIMLKKPFLSSDIFKFVSLKAKIDLNIAKAELDKIKVVPNPYVASADWEPKNPYKSGRGPRSLHFTHLPAKCTIRIFTINGELVNIIEHESPFSNGTAYWDMLSRDNLAISYGVYIYHIEAPGIGEKIGKFAIIK